MKLRYKIPHRVTIRVVGAQFVAACSCKQWARNADLRMYAGLPGAWYENGLPSVVEDLISAAHKHATDHVLQDSSTARSWARRLTIQEAS